MADVEFMSKPLHEYAADILASSGVNIEKEVLDSYLHTHEVRNHDASWEFITKLGMRMGTNFGFAFDPITGERYPKNYLSEREVISNRLLSNSRFTRSPGAFTRRSFSPRPFRN